MLSAQNKHRNKLLVVLSSFNMSKDPTEAETDVLVQLWSYLLSSQCSMESMVVVEIHHMPDLDPS